MGERNEDIWESQGGAGAVCAEVDCRATWVLLLWGPWLTTRAEVTLAALLPADVVGHRLRSGGHDSELHTRKGELGLQLSPLSRILILSLPPPLLLPSLSLPLWCFEIGLSNSRQPDICHIAQAGPNS